MNVKIKAKNNPLSLKRKKNMLTLFLIIWNKLLFETPPKDIIHATFLIDLISILGFEKKFKKKKISAKFP